VYNNSPKKTPISLILNSNLSAALLQTIFIQTHTEQGISPMNKNELKLHHKKNSPCF
jgi:hypothetical protein